MSEATEEHLNKVLAKKTREFTALRAEHLEQQKRLKHEGWDRKTYAVKGFAIGLIVGAAGMFAGGAI